MDMKSNTFLLQVPGIKTSLVVDGLEPYTDCIDMLLVVHTLVVLLKTGPWIFLKIHTQYDIAMTDVHPFLCPKILYIYPLFLH